MVKDEAYCELGCLIVWGWIDDSDGRRWDTEKRGRRGNGVDGDGRLGGNRDWLKTCKRTRVTYRGATDINTEYGSSCTASGLASDE